MNVIIDPSWQQQLQHEFDKSYFEQLTTFVKNEYVTHTVYPPGKLIFNAFNQCPFDNVKVVLLGQDPYHEQGQAHGLCFSVPHGVTPPPSLVNIFNEIQTDLGIPLPNNGDLTRWAQQGVLLLNATLTVKAHQAGSHQNKGWETFTDAVIQQLNQHKKHVVYLLWGSYAQRKGAFISVHDNLVLKSPHPSPLSAYRGFFGNKHFSKTNQYLVQQQLTPIQW
jgi:uracil-DNA glycosylase